MVTSAATLLLALCTSPLAADAHAEHGAHGESLRGGVRKLWDIAAKEKHIWGRCERWDAKVSGCRLHSENKCSDFLSSGPSDADLEITLGNLTPSSPGNEVHLAWWAPRKSVTHWNPVESAEGCSVYWRMNDAYPIYNDSEFNGGNIRVSESGRATIRVKNPATYFVTNWISVPHIHLRLCSNDSHAHTTQDAIIFTREGPEMVGGEEGSTLDLERVVNFTWSDQVGEGMAGGMENGRGIAGILILRKEDPATTSQAMQLPSTSMQPLADSTTTMDTGEVRKIIDDAKNAMNLDALEFSPIFQCFTDYKLYDHFTADCTAECSDSAELAHGQCVRPASESKTSSVVGVWVMRVTCNAECWQSWKNVSLHYSRLAMADLLDIPFQEVTKVEFTFEDAVASGRRLSVERTATMQLMVSTARIPPAEMMSLMQLFLTEADDASDIFHFSVSEVTMTSISGDGVWKDTSKGSTTVTSDSLDNDDDPYQEAYNKAEPPAPGGPLSLGGSITAGLDPAIIFAIAITVVILGFCFGLWVVIRRKRTITELQPGEAMVSAAGTVIGSGRPANPQGKSVDDPDYPTKPAQANPTPQELAAKAQDPW